MAAAVTSLWPDALPTIGPAIENGFYYDFDKLKISKEDLPKIEKEMKKIVKSWNIFEKIEVSADEAIKHFKDNPYKIELIKELIGKGEKITLYKSGSFTDLCSGGHIQSANDIKHFKLLSIAGAYWKGNSDNKMLTRIYGTCFSTQKELDSHIKNLKKAKSRDHKRLGRELDLFLFSPLVGPGLPLWTPKGTILRNLLDDFVWELRRAKGYQKVEIPHIAKKDLYIKSGHWDKFKDDLFRIKSREGSEVALKPMNCPHHTQIYARRPMSYRELPQRYANTTMVYRDEQSGELSGLSRVESITQDDAHVFCRKSQTKEEFIKIWDIVDNFYNIFGFKLRVRLSLHDPRKPKEYIGSKKEWETAEQELRELAQKRGVNTKEEVGEAAFYGPKIDFLATDSLQREWQTATIQLDMNMPERFDLTCINEKGEKERIVMIHAAIMGSLERFLSILIEHYAGAFPTWLSPVQVKVLPITEKNVTYAEKIYKKLEDNGFRVEIDNKNETLQNKIRMAQLEKVPYMLILGKKEEETNKVAVRLRNGKDLGQMELEKFLTKMNDDIEEKTNVW